MAWRPFLSANFPPFPGPPPNLPYLGDDGDKWDQSAFLQLDFRKRVQWMRAACAVQGYGNQSLLGWAFYLGKAWLYLSLFLLFCVRPEESETRTLIRLLAYSSLWECTGMGYGSGPSRGKFLPPVLVSFFHFIYMGTPKVPTNLLPSSLRGSRRGVLEVGLFSLYLNYSVKLALGGKTEGESVGQLALIWIAVCTALGVLDQVFFFAGRSEVIGSMMIAVLLEEFAIGEGEVKSAVGLIQVLIWLWTAMSKLEAWYRFGWCPTSHLVAMRLVPAKFRQALYRDWPRDLNPSQLAQIGAMLGLGMEFVFPVCLAVGGATCGWVGAATTIGYHLVVVLHTGAPLERSVFTLLIAAYSFTSVTGNVFTWLQRAVMDGHYGRNSIVLTFPGLALPHALVLLYICVAHVLVPLFGILYPDRVSRFLTSQTACGNRPSSCWLIKRTAVSKLDLSWSFSSLPHQQLARLYLTSVIDQWEYRTLCEKTLRQLNSRALLDILPLCCGEALDDYLIVEGEAFSGAVLGWSCGLDGEGALLSEVQQRCQFAAHELKHVYIGPVSFTTGEAQWQVADQDSQTTHCGSYSMQQLLNQ
ncbi:hypothetical protein BASA81_000386 [Batrachochytrium salamandrivorans]|nr:hypothetical protein BASA81_000386 [Batrachochytrium salamandrivorans]